MKKKHIKINENGLKLFVEFYLKIKNNKKLFVDFENSNYEDILKKLENVIKNIELTINSTLIYKLKKFSVDTYSYFNNLKLIILENDIALTKEDQSFFNELINKTRHNIEQNYDEITTNIKKNFIESKNELEKINISCFKYKANKKEFLENFNENKENLKKILITFEKHSIKDIGYLKNMSSKEFKHFNEELGNQIKNRFGWSSEKKFTYILNDYEETKLKININYEEYDYFKEDDWKQSKYSKSYKWTKGIYDNYIGHNYAEDKKKISIKLIEEFKIRNSDLKDEILKFCENELNNMKKKLSEYSNIFNINWTHIRKYKKKIIQLSEYLKNNITIFLENK